MTVGNVEIMAALDMVPPPRAPEAMFPDVSPDAWAPYQDSLEGGQLQLYYGVWVVRSQGQTVPVDAGMGPGPHPERGNRTGNLYEELRPILIPATGPTTPTFHLPMKWISCSTPTFTRTTWAGI